MELYDKEYFAALKEEIKEIDKKPILIGFIYLLISIIFFFVWSNIVLEIPILLIVPLGLLISYVATSNKKPIIIGLIFVLSFIIFYIIWFDIFPDFPLLILVFWGLVLPFLLLFSVVKKEDSQALLVVIGLMSSTIYFELFDLIYYYTLYLEDPLKMDSDVCPICEIKDSIQLIVIGIIAILVITTIKVMRTKFALTKKKILRAIFLPSGILVFRLLLYFF